MENNTASQNRKTCNEMCRVDVGTWAPKYGTDFPRCLTGR